MMGRQLARRCVDAALSRAGYRLERADSPSYVRIADYPIRTMSRWGYGSPSHPGVRSVLERGRAEYRKELENAACAERALASVEHFDAGQGNRPSWHNNYFSCLDAVMLVALLLQHAPTRFIEIGSGMSTRFARHAIRVGGLNTKVISIDPAPRADIDELCDVVVRQPLETVSRDFWTTVQPGEIVFFDGSHRVFTNSDVVVFFLEVLPQLPSGVLIHIHDIHWPDDYPPIYHDRFYSEQYLLGVLLMQPRSLMRTLLPNYFVCQDPELGPIARAAVGRDRPFTYPAFPTIPGVSFWGVIQ
jgi:hypothetical protein